MLSLPSAGVETNPPDPAASKPTLQKAEVGTLLAWTHDKLPDGLAERARLLPGVEAATEVRSGIAWLSAWTRDDGTTSNPPAGYEIPIEVAAVDPASYPTFVPPADRAKLLGLGRGEALMGAGGAKLRGIEEHGSLNFGESEILVGGVLEEELVGAHEAVVSWETGVKLGIDSAKYLLLEMAPGAHRSDVDARLRGLVEPGVPMRVRGPGETPVFRHGDAVLPLVRLKELFGEFAAAPEPGGNLDIDPAWLKANIVESWVPILGKVRCHKAIIPALAAALDEIERRGLGGLVHRGDYGGCFNARYMSSEAGAGISHHTFGVAFDFNVQENPVGRVPTLDPRLVEIIERWGFSWGGRWLIPDGMHFEFLRWPLGPKG
jgi:hypothetical protein